jgi:cobaltochelatase CobN
VDDWMYEKVAEAYVLDPAIREFLGKSNPWALHAIADRLLEAEQRGLWAEPNPGLLAALRDAMLASEADLEARGEARPEVAQAGSRLARLGGEAS